MARGLREVVGQNLSSYLPRVIICDELLLLSKGPFTYRRPSSDQRQCRQ